VSHFVRESSFFVPFNCLCAGATLACGTGACATVVAAVLEGRAGRVSLLFDCNTMKTVFKNYYNIYRHDKCDCHCTSASICNHESFLLDIYI
jgi:hypothetical protein